MRILVVEDEPRLAETLTQLLRDGGYEADTVEDGLRGLELAQKGTYGLLVLDVMLPGLDGFGVCRALREKGKSVPILMLTARTQVADKVAGLDCGADDYMTKPFAPEELLARVRALTRRQGESPAQELAFADVRLDAAAHTLSRGERSVQLSPKEFELLRLFLSRPGVAFTREQLLSDIWGVDYTGETRTVDMHIKTLRQKLGNYGGMIETVRHIGYRLEAKA